MPCDSTTDDNGALLLLDPNWNRNPAIDHYWHTYQAQGHFTYDWQNYNGDMAIVELMPEPEDDQAFMRVIPFILDPDDDDDVDAGIQHSIYFDVFIL